MARVKGGLTTRRKHKKILDMAKGYRMTRHKQIKKAKEAVLHAGEYAFHGRKLKKREFRKLWIIRLNAAVRNYGMKYSQFIKNLKTNNIELDRKILSQIANEYPKVFEKIVEKVRN
ncbi:MAG TPA: 50S ribosomal protein L20 [Candidatus Nitrosocosmicus sp.]|nr:50S ribosomal protein L20 [Candidatus Nitrosocosmicus sp.]